MSEPKASPTQSVARSSGRFKPESLRILLAAFFLVFAFVWAQGLVPLMDEPPRVKYRELFFTATGLVFALQCLVNRYRGFWFMLVIYCPLSFMYLGDRIKFLEMMLEPTLNEQVLQYCLAGVLLTLLTPRAWRLFPRKFADYRPEPPLLFRRGFPF
ncbi:hypothetical protein SCOR_11215 [Sulfidibacter corallicola]|uniref:Uncharacterized protein n=1 Tax=Sulfidibacter corallicola TaxID=2818388 RepID=A0A8A4TND0_SULCO|nr:hypothetical protein [Sulfidibacter corallicola]QTD48095.1 hypothetical protein J3U87_21125 [Sulfidibacter corallicola]